MKLAVAIQMDPIESVNIETDSTFALALEAERRGHALHHYLPQNLAFAGGRLKARARALKVWRPRAGESPRALNDAPLSGHAGDHCALGAPETLDLAGFDVVLLRQDPPFDMAYITTTHLLEHIHPATLVVNDPASVRNAPEKLFVTHFPELMPPTLIASDRDEIKAFRAEHREIVVKPLYGGGGAGVFHIGPEDENLNALLEMFTARSREPVMVQKYLPEVRQGDKRIILVDGRAVGALKRVPPPGEARANLHVGARAEKATLDARDREICAAIGPALKEKGLVFVGIDVIGGFLTEINVTSPTGIQEIGRFDGVAIEALIWDAIEARVKTAKA